jgi:hypothetical protein
VLLGFGRNSFGRFSVAGIYDQKTGELRCEKKYMVTKFTAKRGRRSYAECAATAAASGVPPHLLSATYFGAAAHPPPPLLPPSTRQRLAPSALQDDWGVEETGHKRKRGLSLGVAHRDRDSMSALSGSTGRASWGGKGRFECCVFLWAPSVPAVFAVGSLSAVHLVGALLLSAFMIVLRA